MECQPALRVIAESLNIRLVSYEVCELILYVFIPLKVSTKADCKSQIHDHITFEEIEDAGSLRAAILSCGIASLWVQAKCTFE